MAKEEFKSFVKKNPRLIKYIKNKEMTWQSFYEIYDMYGEDENAWKPYLADEQKIESKNMDFMKYIKNIDLDAVQESINSIQRVLGVVSDLSIKSNTQDTTSQVKPLYQHLDD